MMKHQKHHGIDIKGSFPYDIHPEMLPNQEEILDIIEQLQGSAIIEAPTGSGKTAAEFTILHANERAGRGPLFLIVPTKTLVEQVKSMFPSVRVAYGRNEHPCFYYPDENLKADEIPCSLLKDCPHRVNQDTGETHKSGAIPCPYLPGLTQLK